MIIIGLTGSLAMGKSTVARLLQQNFHFPIWDADGEVRELWQSNQTLITEVSKKFPQVMRNGKIARAELRILAFNNPKVLKHLEALIYPYVKKSCNQFIAKTKRLQVPICVLDVPLLFEVGWDQFCDYTIVVSAPAFLQRQRILNRKGMTLEQMNHVLKLQLPDQEKRKRADYVILSGLSKWYTFIQLKKVIRNIKQCAKLS